MNIIDKEQEKQFFNKTFESDSRKSVSKFYLAASSSREYYRKLLLSLCNNQEILEYGCGLGSYAFLLAKNGGKIVGIDISEVAIEMAKAQAKHENLENITFYLDDAEAMKFNNDRFDIICGTSILHHLDIEKALKEITRVLKSEGKAIFIEPMGHNPFINLFRKLTPHLRTEDEHPLTKKDLKRMKNFFYRINFNFFHLFSLFAVPFRNSRVFSSLLKILDNFDQTLFKRIPSFGLLAWQVVIILDKPKKQFSSRV